LLTKKNDQGNFVFNGDEGRARIRSELKKLNFYGSTMSLDHLDLGNLEDLLSLNK